MCSTGLVQHKSGMGLSKPQFAFSSVSWRWFGGCHPAPSQRSAATADPQLRYKQSHRGRMSEAAARISSVHAGESGESLRGGPIEQDSPKTRSGFADEVPRSRRSERKQKTHTRKDGNPLIDGRGSWRRMRGRLDVVERELVRLSKSTSSDYSLTLKGIQHRD